MASRYVDRNFERTLAPFYQARDSVLCSEARSYRKFHVDDALPCIKPCSGGLEGAGRTESHGVGALGIQGCRNF